MSADKTLLEQLNALSSVVPETAKLDVIARLKPQHVSLSTARITAAAQLPEHGDIVDTAVRWAQQAVGKGGIRKRVAARAVERLPVELGRRILELIPGHISVELDGRLAYKRRPTLERARTVIRWFDEAGVDSRRVLVKIPATWEGIEAARKLQSKDGIQCHMTLVFGLHQAAACADAGAALIAPSVGRITDWHLKQQGVEGFAPAEDPGVLLAARMHSYLKQHGYETQLMPSTFRSVAQPLALAGVDLLCLPKVLVEELEQTQGTVERQVGAEPGAAEAKLELDKAQFERLHAADRMAGTKLSAGVKNLSWAFVSQEKQLIDWILARQDEAAKTSAATLFAIWDFDGDGFVDREEWGGTDEVFNALDRNKDGRITLEEMAIGLGAPRPTND